MRARDRSEFRAMGNEVAARREIHPRIFDGRAAARRRDAPRHARVSLVRRRRRAVWAGSAVAAGRVFHHAIDQILQRIESLGGWAVVLVLGIIVLWVLMKWWQRARFLK